MPARGKFIVFEGIDGSGKRTQLDLLSAELARRGIAASKISFPNYSGFFGKLVAKFLNGEFGALHTVDPHFSALLYAGDRLEAKNFLDASLAAGQTILSDRYIASNLAHQGARVAPEKRAEFVRWLKQLEYEIYRLPAEDLVIYLQVPVAEAHRLIAKKGARDYTNLRRDIQESDLAHLKAASEVYESLAQQPNWLTVRCFDAQAGAMRSPEKIHADVLAAAETHISAAAAGAKG